MRITTMRMMMLALGLATFSSPVSAQPREIASLKYPADFHPSSLKIWPENKIYGLSAVSKARLIVFDIHGDVLKDINLLRDRPTEATYWFFDFYVDRDGDIYALAVWRNERASKKVIHSGVFLYDKNGAFREVVEFTKHVDGLQRIVVDDQKNIIVAGLMGDFHFGKSNVIHLLHKYDRQGKHLASFFELNWGDYLQPGQNEAVEVYRNLRPLVDYLPMGIHERRGIFTVAPGSSRIEFFDPLTLQRSEQIELQPPPPQASTLTGYTRRDTRIWNVQVGTHSIVAEFHQTTVATGRRQSVRIMSTFKDDGRIPEGVGLQSREDESLMSIVGAGNLDQAFTFSTSGGGPRVKSIR